MGFLDNLRLKFTIHTFKESIIEDAKKRGSNVLIAYKGDNSAEINDDGSITLSFEKTLNLDRFTVRYTDGMVGTIVTTIQKNGEMKLLEMDVNNKEGIIVKYIDLFYGYDVNDKEDIIKKYIGYTE